MEKRPGRQRAAPPTSADSALIEQAIERTRALVRTARARFQTDIPEPEIRLDLRGTAAGQAIVTRRRTAVIRYNRALLVRHGEAFLAQTIPHEVAHLVAYWRHGPRIRPHGKEWQAIVRAFGAEPTRCHDYDLSGVARRTMRRFTYHCACGEHRLSAVRHNRVLDGRQRYVCQRCGHTLAPGASPDAAG